MSAKVTRLLTPHEIDYRANAYTALEPAIEDIYRMSMIAAQAVFAVGDAHDDELRAARMEIAIFAAEHLTKMIGELKDDYKHG